MYQEMKHQGITVPMRNFPITVESSQKISIHVIQKVYLQQSKDFSLSELRNTVRNS